LYGVTDEVAIIKKRLTLAISMASALALNSLGSL